MVSIYQLKPRFQSLLRPVARRLAAAGITANSVTLAAMLVSLALGALLGAAGNERCFSCCRCGCSCTWRSPG